MLENTKTNWARMVAIILSLLSFVVFTPGAAKEWYQIGTGLSYDKELTMAGLTHQQSTASASHDARIERSKRNGIIYSVLMVNSTHLPLLFFLLLAVFLITTPLSQVLNKKLLILIPAILIWGIAFSGFAHIMISSLPLSDAFLGASVIWIGFTAIFAVVLAVGLFTRKILVKRKYAS